MNKHIIIGLLGAVLVTGCAVFDGSISASELMLSGKKTELKSKNSKDSPELITAIDDMARQLFATKRFVTKETPIAVTSFVELASLQKTSKIGNQMAESFVYHLQANGLRVIEYKAPGYIKVTEDGDYALSRNYEDLTGSFDIDYILTGTYSSMPQGMLVNVRMFAARSKIVVASAQGFIPNQALALEPIKNTDGQTMQIEHGSLVRKEQPVIEPKKRKDSGGWL